MFPVLLMDCLHITLTEEVACSNKETLFSTSFTIVAGEVSCLLSVLHADLHEDHVISQISHVTSVSIRVTPVEPELSTGRSCSAVIPSKSCYHYCNISTS